MPIQSTEVNPSSLDSSPILFHEFTPCTQQVLKKCSVQITPISIVETLVQPIIPHDDDIPESVDLPQETSCSCYIHPSSTTHFPSMRSSPISSDELTPSPKGHNISVITSSSKQNVWREHPSIRNVYAIIYSTNVQPIAFLKLILERFF